MDTSADSAADAVVLISLLEAKLAVLRRRVAAKASVIPRVVAAKAAALRVMNMRQRNGGRTIRESLKANALGGAGTSRESSAASGLPRSLFLLAT